MGEEERRCESMYSKAIGDPWVRCDRWIGHAGEHRGHDVQDMEYQWPSTPGEQWRQPEDRRMGQEPPESSLLDELQKLERSASYWEREAERFKRQRDEGTAGLARERDEARRQLVETLRAIRKLTNGVPSADA